MKRRAFLKAAVPFLPGILRSGAASPNDQLTYALIGAGSRGRYLNRAFQKLGARCRALCDVYEPNLEAARAESPPDVRTYVDYRELLAKETVDFVVVATPDHHHRPCLLAALEARRDVYLEKPLSLNLEESQLMMEAVRQSDRIVQVGMQRRSLPFVLKAKSVIEQGMLGQLSMVEASWNWAFELPLDNSPLPGKLHWDLFLGPAPKRPFEPRRFRWWRAFWDYSGGNMTDQGTHLMDVVQWFAESGPPLTAVCHGKILNAPGAEVPNVFSAVFEYPNFIATWTLNYRTDYNFDWSIRFHGEEATMVIDRFGYRIYRNNKHTSQPWQHQAQLQLIAEEKDPGGTSTEPHIANFLDCVRTRRQPNCTVEIAAAAVAGPHLANIAYREGRLVRFAEEQARVAAALRRKQL